MTDTHFAIWQERQGTMRALVEYVREWWVDAIGMGTLLLLLIVGVGNMIATCLMHQGIATLQAEIRLNDQNAARRAESVEQAIKESQVHIEAFMMQHSTPIQLGSLTAEEVAKLNVQLAMAIAANTGCKVNLTCDVEE